MLLALLLTLPVPADWVPARWHWTEPESLSLLKGTPINCLLLEWNANRAAPISSFASEAAERGIATLGVIRPTTDPLESARQALRAKLTGIVLEGDFPSGAADRVQEGLQNSKAVVIELTSRSRMKLGTGAPVIGTYQGVWPGIQVLDDGAAKAGPSGSPWIDTNSGFLRSVRAWGNSAIWLGNLPPPNTIVTGERYLQAISDAAMAGGRWVLALDDDFSKRLGQRDPAALKDWQRMAKHLSFFEDHREWRAFRPFGKLAVVQDVNDGALLSGGILDMISARHTPVRAIPPQRLNAEALRGANMAVNVDNDSLTPEQRETLRKFRVSGATVLTGPPGWRGSAAGNKDEITMGKEEVKRLDDIWHDVQSMIGRSNLGARLFNVSSMLSNLLAKEDGKQVIVHLVNYSSYPVESVAVHLLGKFKHARLYAPEGVERDLELYQAEDGTGVDIDKVSVVATLLLE